MLLPNPKRVSESDDSLTSFYNYYAGYSASFVKGALLRLELQQDAVVLDPWNGSGTTTCVAHNSGFKAIGFDLNPVMVIAAKARMASHSEISNSIAYAQNLLTSINEANQSDDLQYDPLSQWFQPNSVAAIRTLVRRLGISVAQPNILEVDKLTPTMAFYWVALFRTCRSILSRFLGSNPTWIRVPSSLRERSRPSRTLIVDTFLHQLNKMSNRSTSEFNWQSKSKNGYPRIEIAHSEKLPLPSSSVDAILTSPPYCTRIDYVVSTLVELSLLGVGNRSDLKGLRDEMVGTPTMRKAKPLAELEWGKSCLTFLAAVYEHKSRASRSYYFPFYSQYFDSMWRSLQELNRVLKPAGRVVIVVQDSFYKDVHVDLAQIISEMSAELRWQIDARYDYRLTHTLAGINPKRKGYRTDASATESVLFATKPS